ncbi:glycosyltransferase family 90 protein [Moniliophthora roreri MCA 2997]|uniref:Glycosyltransferase family 90 protein n=1 Tax=Moniliophthora roreri (strain MCA 2997) TaxID=1381753 RepID=V2WFY2_MONRO|nr:glycosyltransferase family 90 protein [Moniliophthora roreri MCA 2997]
MSPSPRDGMLRHTYRILYPRRLSRTTLTFLFVCTIILTAIRAGSWPTRTSHQVVAAAAVVKSTDSEEEVPRLKISRPRPHTSRRRKAYASTTWSSHSASLSRHTYHHDGLFEVNPLALSANNTHPVETLIHRSRLLWAQKLHRQSRTLLEAVEEYRRRYAREPPLGFNKWWAYVQEHNVQLPDEYDQIWRDVEAFWGFEARALRVAHESFSRKRKDGVYVIGKETWEENIKVFDNTTYHEDMTFGGRLLIQLLHNSGVEKHIPPFRIVVNPDDRPLIQKDWVLWNMAVQQARVGSVLPPLYMDPPPGKGWLSSCDPTSPAWYTRVDYTLHKKPALRGSPQTLIHTHTEAMDPCLNPHLFRQHGQFLSYDRGRGPNLPQYDYLDDEAIGWVGVISFSPTKLHSDMTAAIPLEWVEDSPDEQVPEGLELDWNSESATTDTSQPAWVVDESIIAEQWGIDMEFDDADVAEHVFGGIRRSLPLWEKRSTVSGEEKAAESIQILTKEAYRWALKGFDERLHWRGSNTGMWHGGEMEWELAHRIRMMDMLGVGVGIEGSTSIADELRQRVAVDIFPKAIVYPDKMKILGPDFEEKVDRVKWTNAMMDVSFSGTPTACAPAVCDELGRRYPWGEGVPREGVGRERKFLLDIDGNAWSSRFKRLISSGSVVFKSTVYPEWFTDRIQPWVHYVPVQIDLSDLWDTFAFFHGDPNGAHHHDEFAREIGNDAWEWSRSFWRREDMVAYNFRLLLEYARAMNDDRDTMFYSYDPKDEVVNDNVS